MRKTSGISMMLLIFLSLCLIVFSLLSLSSAVADQKLSRKLSDRTTEYYQADSLARQALMNLDQYLSGILKEAEASSDPGKTFMQSLSSLENYSPEIDSVSAFSLSEDNLLSFQTEINEKQILLSTVQLHYPENDEDVCWEIVCWQVININDWTADTSMDLFRMET